MPSQLPVMKSAKKSRANLVVQLLALGQRRKRLHIVSGLAILAIAVFLFFNGLFLVERYFPLPAIVRALLLVVSSLGFLALAYNRVVVWFFEPVKPSRVAHLLEERYPKLNDSLASAVAFQNESADDHTSARFRGIAAIRAQRQLDKVNLNPLFPVKRAWWSSLCAVALLFFSLGVLGAYTKHV